MILFTSQEFKLGILKECLRLGLRRTLDQIQRQTNMSPIPPQLSTTPTPDPSSPSHRQPLDPLYKATHVTVLRHVNSIINTLPVPHQMMTFQAVMTHNVEEEYHEKMFDLFADVRLTGILV